MRRLIGVVWLGLAGCPDVLQCEDGPELVSCPEDVDGLDCDTMAVPSVDVEVFDAAGDVVVDARVEWSDDGGITWTACEFGPNWTCAYEVAGDLEVRAEAPGYEPDSMAVSVSAGHCHVETEYVALVLEAL